MMWLFGALPATEAKSFLSCTRSGVQHRSQVSELFLVMLFISSGREDLWTVVCILCFFAHVEMMLMNLSCCDGLY